MVKVLFIYSNHEDLGTTGKKTGWYLPEVAHPYYVFKDAGFEIEACSPKGGKCLMFADSGDMFGDDPSCKKLLADQEALALIENTQVASDVDFKQYKIVFFPGGHAPMYDLPDVESTNQLAAQVYENNGIVCAVCHGTAGIVNTKLSNGQYLIAGRKVTSFTNEEENQYQLMPFMPFPLQTKLSENGGEFVESSPWSTNVTVDGRLICGQNPQSATLMAEEVVKAVKAL